MKKFILLLFICLISALSAYSVQKNDFPKPVVVSFFSDDCDECELVKMVQVQNQIEFGKDVDFIEINFDDEDCDYTALKKRYNITKAPTTLFIGPQAAVTKKVAGYMPYKIYQKTIQSILPEVKE